MEEIKKYLEGLWGIKINNLPKEQIEQERYMKTILIEIDKENKILNEKIDNSIVILKRSIIQSKINLDILKDLLKIEPTEILSQLNILISKCVFNQNLLNSILPLKDNFETKTNNLINSYNSMNLKVPTVEINDLIILLEDLKEELNSSINKFLK
jgi:hypothetical protein